MKEQPVSLERNLGYLSPDYLEEGVHTLNVEGIRALREEREFRLWDDKVQRYREAVGSVQDLQASSWDFSSDVISVGTADLLTKEQRSRWEQALRAFCPWKKGPFSLFGTTIDAEWRSEWKWNRILPHISSLEGKTVADIGCHNGYFMFRMAEQKPRWVVGFEPYAKHFWNFQLVQNLVQQPNLAFELLGVEHFDLYPKFFDTIFCLGILYHHTDPLGLLRSMRQALTPKGEIVVDCQGIAGEEPLSLTPRGRYANARGIWFLPTRSCLEHWMNRAGFANVRTIFSEPLSVDEQRPTPWAEIQSLEHFLDPNDPTRTIEGYPAPWRHYIVASRG